LLIFTFTIPAQAECYTYDDLGRLISVVYDNTGAAKRTYNLDKHGNRTTVQDVTAGGGACSVPTGTTSNGVNAPVDSSQYASTGGGPPPATNTPPVADTENITLTVNTSMTVDPLGGDTDADVGDVLTLASINENSPLITTVQAGNSVLVTAGSSAGTASFTYIVSDGNGGTATGSVFVTIRVDNNPCIDNPSSPECFGGGDDGIIPE